jgi:hypothetical protein
VIAEQLRRAEVKSLMANPWRRRARLRSVLVTLTCALTTPAVTVALVLGIHRLGLDRPGPRSTAIGAGLFAVAVLLNLSGHRATRMMLRRRTRWRSRRKGAPPSSDDR